ncbi:Protein SSD1 [Nakaseomyces bracarensis]|uniref:Protein SSD1 n=1 Tax=Nakaseomyces bracarensis TaxID=273131 RepID=A0ABR4NSF0_9SACH
MSKNSYDGNSRQDNGGNYVATTGGGKNVPKQIHVAHRRSQSELTSLMIEQFTLQKQLEAVQAQQQQLLQQQQQLAQQTGQLFAQQNPVGQDTLIEGVSTGVGTGSVAPGLQNAATTSAGNFLPQPPNPHYNSTNMSSNASSNLASPNNMTMGGNRSRSHSRNNSGYYYSNTFDGASATTPSGPNAHRRTGSQSSVYGHSRRHSLGLNEAKKAAAEEQAKRVAGINDSVSGVNVKIEAVSPDLGSQEQSGFEFPQKTHRRTNSNLSPSAFKFPATATTPVGSSANNDDDFTPTSSVNRRSRNRNSEYNINTNWRVQSQQQQQQQQGQGNQQNQYQNNQRSPFRHRPSNSRDFNSFSTLEPPAVFQQGHKHRNSNSSVHSFSSNSGGNNQNTRKSLFAPYLPQANIPQLIEEGRLVAGILRVNKKNRSDAWVSTDGSLDADIYICGSKDRNRALEGDLVAVELLVVDDVWESKKEKEEKKRRKDALQQDIIPLNSSDDYHNDASATPNASAQPYNSDDVILSMKSDGHDSSPTKSGVKRKGSLKQRPTQKKNDDVEVEGQSLLLVEEEEINDKFKPLYAGHVVAVLDRIPGQLFSGTLGLLRPSQQANNDNSRPQQAPKIAWFKPTDKKVPLIAIPTELAPKDFVENADKYADRLFVASIKRWPITSLHPFGILVSELGEINNPNTEIDSILRDNNFLSNEYSDPKNPSKEKTTFQPVEISESAVASRKQFDQSHGYSVLAIVENGTISEFATHLKRDNDGNLELGCHVVDVTSYIDEGSSLDRRARKRSSGVFMPQKVVNLLPETMNNALSLKPNKNTLTLSVVYTLEPTTLKIKDTWVGTSNVIPSATMSITELDKRYSSGSADPVCSALKDIATKFYADRINMPEATLNTTLSLLDSLDDEKVKVDLNIFSANMGFTVINELHRKVNSTVAEKLYTKLGDLAFLRRQTPPIATKLTSFIKKVEHYGYKIDTFSADTIIRSLMSINDPDIRMGVEILLYKTMSRARYFIAGKLDPDQYGHYVLNLPIYTHFTAPMRRYADHVVHRQLKSVIYDVPYTENMDALKITSEYCNFKKDCAVQAQEQAIHLLLCKTINDMGNTTGQLLTMATVLQVYESSFDVFIPEFGIEKRVHGDQLPLSKAEFDPINRVLELHWQPGVDSATFVPPDEKNPKSYRNSIKNKFRSTTAEIADSEFSSSNDNSSLISDDLSKELAKLSLTVPQLRLPERTDKNNALNNFLSTINTKTENENHIQEVYELQKIPILLRAEIGMALPCLSVRTLNPFMRTEAKR